MKTSLTKKLALTLAAILLLGLALPSVSVFADPKAAAPAFLLGDVDMNGTVEAADARLALRAAVGLENYDYCSYQASAAEVDRDNLIAAGDARLILRAAVGLETLQAGIKESCDLFTLTLPSQWKGKYTVKKDATGISFYHKASQQNGYNGYLFKIYAVTQEQAKREMDMSEFAFMLDNAGRTLAVLIGRPGDSQEDPAYHEEYNTMAENAYAVAGTLQPSAWNAYPYFKDYSGLVGSYAGTAIGDITYELTITEVWRNSVSGVLALVPSNGDEVSTAETYFLLFDDEGLATWTDPNDMYYGGVRLDGDKIILDTGNAKEHWSYSPSPITFSPRESVIDPADFNDHELTAAQSEQVMERLRGVWINDQNNYVIGFIQDGGDSEQKPGWTLFCGAPQAGYDISGLVQFPVCGDPNGVVRLHTQQPAYTDMDGGYHPAIEFNIYVDLKMRNDNSISWTNEGYSWERCSYYAAHPSLVNEYGEALSWKETKTILESLRGVWMNDDRNYFIAFSQADSDTWEAMFGVPESEFDLSGLVTEISRSAQNKNRLRLTVNGSTLNGEMVEAWIWLDLSRKTDNTVLWSNDENEWEACRFFCLGVEQIPDRL